MEQNLIVIIDDDAEDLDLMKEVARACGCPNEIITFVSPEAALVFLQKTKQALLFILCDVNMPKMDGFRLRGELLKISGAKDVPFFFLSTAKTEREEMLTKDLNIDGYYAKAPSFEGMKDNFQQMIAYLKRG